MITHKVRHEPDLSSSPLETRRSDVKPSLIHVVTLGCLGFFPILEPPFLPRLLLLPVEGLATLVVMCVRKIGG